MHDEHETHALDPDLGALSVVLLGTHGGPPPQRHRRGIGSVLHVDGKSYIIDLGRAAVTQYVELGLRFADVAGVFLTHLHADHIADYFNLFMLGGNVSPRFHDSLPEHVPVYGPGPAGGLPPTLGGGVSPTANPADPTPGLAALTSSCLDAFAYSTNLFMRDSHVRNTSDLIDVHEIVLPTEVHADFTATAPAMSPFTVMEDERVRVSAVLVPHGPVFPAFAYRFDTDHGSVVFSGDTTYTDNIPALANGADLLIHEAINVEGFHGEPALISHLLESHVEVQKVGAIAQRSGVGRLVLSHIGDLAATGRGLDSEQWRRWAQQGFDGPAEIGEDGMIIRLA